MQNHFPTEPEKFRLVGIVGGIEIKCSAGGTHTSYSDPQHTIKYIMGPIKIQLSTDKGIQWTHILQRSVMLICEVGWIQ